MPTKLFNCIVFLLSKLGLKNVHRIGKYFGTTYFWIRKKNYSLLVDNLDNAKIFTKTNLADAISINTQELGKSILESFYLWASNQSIALSLVKNVYGLDCLKSMHSNGKGIIFLTPSLRMLRNNLNFLRGKKPHNYYV